MAIKLFFKTEKVREYALILASSTLIILSFPKIAWSFLIWIAFLPFLKAIEKKSAGRRFQLGYLTGCGYCMPCPNKVDIPTNLLLLNYIRIYGSQQNFREGFTQLYHKRLVPKEEAAEFCIECGECLEKCPQKIEISERMKDVAAEQAKFK